jgi:predicted DCC family thiol-disulfide oxidoreductase YuxK
VTTSIEIELFYDGACPLCRREVAMLRRLDRRGRLGFTDIAAAGFDPEPLGVTRAALMARIHGRLANGALVEGMEVFRRAYAAVGFGPLVAVTRLPGLRRLFDTTYRLFAANRLRLTGRCAAGSCERTTWVRSGG